jgi:hypothetical protein
MDNATVPTIVMPETAVTETTQTVKPEVKAPIERVNAILVNAKNFFVAQAKRYEDNARRTELLSIINERLAPLTVSEEKANSLFEEAGKQTGQRSVKWNQEMLNFTNAKGYAVSELRDKVNEMVPGLNKKVYEAVLAVVETWEDIAVALPCPWNTCRCNTFVKADKGVDGLFRAACTNPNHMRIETPTGAETANQAIENWNRLVQNN